MTRLLALADTQIGVGTVTLEDQRVVLDQIIQAAVEREVNMVVHGGDVFEGPIVTPEQLRMFIDATLPLREHGIPMLILRGNGRHDSAVRHVHALDVLREIPGFMVSDRPTSYVGDTFEICTLPWVSMARLKATTNGHADFDSLNEWASAALARVAAELRKSELPSVLVAHWAISGSKLPSGLAVEEMREPVIPWAELDAAGYDVVIGAHIHEPQIISNADLDASVGIVVGSPQQLNHGEKGEHGYWIVDLGDHGDGYPAWDFFPVKSRQFVTLELGDENWDVPDGAIVRVRGRMTVEEAQKIDYAEIRARLLEAGAHSARLDIDVVREARARAEINEDVSAEEAMALYCDAVGITDPLRSEMLALIKAWGQE